VEAGQEERNHQGGIEEAQGGQFHCVPGVADVVPKATCLVGPDLLQGEGHGVEEEEDPPDESRALEAPGVGVEGERHEVGDEGGEVDGQEQGDGQQELVDGAGEAFPVCVRTWLCVSIYVCEYICVCLCI
jgi:hypothetical protein